MTALDLMILWLCFVSMTRIVTYKRDGARFKRAYGVLAWLLICAIGALGIHILGGKLCSDHYPMLLPFMIILTLLLLHTRGNVAHLVNPRRLLHD